MGRNCSIRCCFVGKNKNLSITRMGLSVHSFPQDENLRRQWVELIRPFRPGEEDTWEPSIHSAICSIHFKAEDFIYVRSDSNERRSKLRGNDFLTRQKLHPEALPCIFPTEEEYEARERDCMKALNLSPAKKRSKASVRRTTRRGEAASAEVMDDFAAAAEAGAVVVENLHQVREWLQSEETVLPEDVMVIPNREKVILALLESDHLDDLEVIYALTIKPDLSFGLKCNNKMLASFEVRHITRQERIENTSHILRLLAFLEHCVKNSRGMSNGQCGDETMDQSSVLKHPAKSEDPVHAVTDPVQLMLHLRETYLKQRPGLLQRPFRPSKVEQDSNQLSVLQWNTLAMALSRPGGDFVCPPSVLHWPSRRALILEEIVNRNVDLISLQEVDSFSFFAQHLTPLGYTGHFSPNPRSPCLDQEVNIGPDGSAIFYRSGRFEELARGARVLRNTEGAPTKSTVLWVRLRERRPLAGAGAGAGARPEVTLMTTHLKAKESKECSEIRRQQAFDLIRAAKEINATTGANFASSPPPTFLLCGDFNCEPETEPCQLIRQQFEPKLESAYDNLVFGPDLYSTWKIRHSVGEKKRCIDYIWYSPDSLSVQQVLSTPEEQQMPQQRLPSLNYPSDHLNLVAKFKYTWKNS